MKTAWKPLTRTVQILIRGHRFVESFTLVHATAFVGMPCLQGPHATQTAGMHLQ